MKRFITRVKKVISLLVACLFAVSSMAQDNFSPSNLPPGGIDYNTVPMFVVLGFDDNAYADGVNWIADFMREKTNANGTKCRASFYNSSAFAVNTNYAPAHQTLDQVYDSWETLVYDGHEVSNHTMVHAHGASYTRQQWDSEILGCNDFLYNTLGVGQAYGFRTPFLEFGTPTFEALSDAGLMYDCSIEYGYGAGQMADVPGQGNLWVSHGNELGHKWGIYWPYTLDNGGAPQSYDKSIAPIPGYWEFMVNTFLKTGGTGEVVGFDYNVFGPSNYSGPDALALWKYNFDLQRNGYKAPFMLNLHSDYYTSHNASAVTVFPASDVASRRKALEDFINYVLTFNDVRVVPAHEVVEWMRQPVSYSNDTPTSYKLNVYATNGVVNVSPNKASYSPGEVVTLSVTADTDYKLRKWLGTGVNTTDATVQITMNEDIDVSATFDYYPSSCSSFTLDLMNWAGFWSANDNLGSSATVDDTQKPASVKANWSMVAKTGADWPWITIGASTDTLFTEGCDITITYKSDQAIAMSLPHPPVNETGESYMTVLPPTDGAFVTVTKNFFDFAQPSWATTIIELDLSKVSSVEIYPDVNAEEGAFSGSFEISKLVINEVSTGQQNISKKGSSIGYDAYLAGSSKLHVQVPQNGEYLIGIYSVTGQLINSTQQNLHAGVNAIALDQQFAPNIYLVKIQGHAGEVTKKIYVK